MYPGLACVALLEKDKKVAMCRGEILSISKNNTGQAISAVIMFIDYDMRQSCRREEIFEVSTSDLLLIPKLTFYGVEISVKAGLLILIKLNEY